jgi:hypothetical protein
MRTNLSSFRALLAAAAVGCALVVAACGSNDDKIKDVQKQGVELQKQGQAVQASAQKTAADLKAGKITAEEAQKQIEAQTKDLEKSAKKTASDAIDAAKGSSAVDDETQKALEDAQRQLATP